MREWAQGVKRRSLTGIFHRFFRVDRTILLPGLRGSAMIGRGIFMGLLALALAGCGNGYSHIVDKPQADVVAALEDLDITKQPGNPGTDPSASGGVAPEIRLEKAADHMT